MPSPWLTMKPCPACKGEARPDCPQCLGRGSVEVPAGTDRWEPVNMKEIDLLWSSGAAVCFACPCGAKVQINDDWPYERACACGRKYRLRVLLEVEVQGNA